MTMPRSTRRIAVARLVLAAFMVGSLPPDLLAQSDASAQPTTPQPTTPAQAGPGPQAAPDQFQAPWTQEKKIPPEVKAKEKENPVAWCPKPQKDGSTDWEVNYLDGKTGAITTIKYGTRPTADGKGKKPFWKITLKEPGKPKQETTYDLEPGHETKTVQTGGAPAKTTTLDPAKDLAEPAKTATAQAATPPQGGSGQAPQTDRTPKAAGPPPQAPRSGEPPVAPTPATPAPTAPGQTPAGPAPATPAPTTPGQPGTTPSTPRAGTTPPATPSQPEDKTTTGQTPTTPVLNLKPVTWGGPPPETTITWEPEHPTTPTEVAKRPEEPPLTGQPTPENPWHPGDEQGPQTGLPTPTGGPGGGQPGGGQPGGGWPGGGWINIGFGWAATRVPWDAINGCTTEPDDGLPPPTTHARDTTPPPAGGTTTDTPPTPTAPPPTTDQPPPAGTTTEPKPVGTTPPPQTPQPPEMVCGPDITKQVLRVLDKMFSDFDSWDAYKQHRKCTGITEANLPYALRAWDIDQLSPGTAPQKEGDRGWFQPYAKGCCKPDYPCGATVVFLGVCQHAQVVNYVQWGAMTQLCNQSFLNPLRHWLRSGPGIFSSDVHYDEQKAMSKVGETYMRSLRQQKMDEGRRTRSNEEWERLETDRRKELEKILADNEKGSGRPEKACAMTCKLTPQEQRFLDLLQFGYEWFEQGVDPDTGKQERRSP